jgi:hypothetical protein
MYNGFARATTDYRAQRRSSNPIPGSPLILVRRPRVEMRMLVSGDAPSHGRRFAQMIFVTSELRVQRSAAAAVSAAFCLVAQAEECFCLVNPQIAAGCEKGDPDSPVGFCMAASFDPE